MPGNVREDGKTEGLPLADDEISTEAQSQEHKRQLL